MSAIARWCFRHRFVVIAAWVVVLTGLAALGQVVKSSYDNSFSLPGTGSAMAQQLLARAVPAQAGDSDTIVWQVSTGTVRDRINEEWVYGRNSRRAVRTGQTQTAGVITAAATIMICVFLAFALTGQRDIAEFGISLAAAVALDAFILRTVLVPAAMHLFGDANWWLPRWKDRLLPHLAIEPPKDTPAPPAPTVPALR